jgi:RimJ/RimL family protein N-acetyltransferase
MSGHGPSSAEEYLTDTARWQHRNQAICLATILRDEDLAIGMISLSHVDLPARTGRIGYWTASAHWNKGYTREAFGLVLQLAQSLELKTISANIQTGNAASERIYLRHGAQRENEAACRSIYVVHLP